MTGNPTVIHRIPAGIKLVALVSCTIAVFSVSTPVLAALSVVLVLLAILARLDITLVVGTVKLVICYGVFIALFRIAGKEPVPAILVGELLKTACYLWQLGAVLLAGALFYATTGTTEISSFLSAVQKAVRWKAPLPDIAFLLSLTIGFIPRVFTAWESINLAWDARGGAVKKSPAAAFRRFTTLVPLLVINLLEIASDTDRAIKNRSL
jgi:energy-coupling factor transporter transmembrane protein EcfT